MIDVNKRNSRVHMFTKIVLQFVKIHIQCMPTLYLYKSKNELFTIMYLQLRRSWTQFDAFS